MAVKTLPENPARKILRGAFIRLTEIFFEGFHGISGRGYDCPDGGMIGAAAVIVAGESSFKNAMQAWVFPPTHILASTTAIDYLN
jgi:hypothetical protein